MTHHLRYTIVILLIFSAKLSFCQQDSMILHYGKDCRDSLTQSDTFLTKVDLLQKLFEKGYPYAIIDSNRLSSDRIVQYQVDCGPHIKVVSIRWSDSQQVVSDMNMHKVIPWNDVIAQRKEFLTKMANKGYPYTRLLTLPKGVSGDTLRLEYALDTIRRIYIQDVEIEGKFSMNPTLFETMTSIAEGRVFSLD